VERYYISRESNTVRNV